MPYLYAVRCNFTRPDLEASFNAWYSVEKIAQLLAKPMFRAVQRFRLAGGGGRGYLAFWQVDAPGAFDTPEYKADWGFAQWRAHITDWSRDLFDAGAMQDAALAVPSEGALAVYSFDGMAVEAAGAARRALEDEAPAQGGQTMWFPCVGLDRHTPLIGLRCFADAAAARSSLPRATPMGVQAGLYRPLNAFATAAARVRT